MTSDSLGGNCMVPFSYVHNDSVWGTIGIIVYILYIIYITKDKKYYVNHTYKLSYLLFVLHIALVLLLVLELHVSVQYANEGWFVPFALSFSFDWLRYRLDIINKGRKKIE